MVATISNVLVMEIGSTDVGSGGYILVSCAHSNNSSIRFLNCSNSLAFVCLSFHHQIIISSYCNMIYFTLFYNKKRSYNSVYRRSSLSLYSSNTVKPVHVVIFIKQSPVLKGHPFPFLSQKIHINSTSFKRSPVLKDHFFFVTNVTS